MTKVLLTLAFAAVMSVLTFAASLADAPGAPASRTDVATLTH